MIIDDGIIKFRILLQVKMIATFRILQDFTWFVSISYL